MRIHQLHSKTGKSSVISLTHLGLWLVRSRPPPKIRTAITLSESKASDSFAHPPHQQAEAYADPQYPWDAYIYPEGTRSHNALLIFQ